MMYGLCCQQLGFGRLLRETEVGSRHAPRFCSPLEFLCSKPKSKLGLEAVALANCDIPLSGSRVWCFVAYFKLGNDLVKVSVYHCLKC